MFGLTLVKEALKILPPATEQTTITKRTSAADKLQQQVIKEFDCSI